MLKIISSLQAHIIFGIIFILFSNQQNNLTIGWNVSTLAHLIIILTILSGAVGIYATTALSYAFNQTSFLKKTDELIDVITLIDRFLMDTAFILPEEIKKSVISAVKDTRVDVVRIIDAGFWKGLLIQEYHGSSSIALTILKQHTASDKSEEKSLKKIENWLHNKITLYAEFKNIIKVRYYYGLWRIMHTQLIIGSVVFSSLHIFNLYY